VALHHDGDGSRVAWRRLRMAWRPPPSKPRL